MQVNAPKDRSRLLSFLSFLRPVRPTEPVEIHDATWAEIPGMAASCSLRSQLSIAHVSDHHADANMLGDLEIACCWCRGPRTRGRFLTHPEMLCMSQRGITLTATLSATSMKLTSRFSVERTEMKLLWSSAETPHRRKVRFLPRTWVSRRTATWCTSFHPEKVFLLQEFGLDMVSWHS